MLSFVQLAFFVLKSLIVKQMRKQDIMTLFLGFRRGSVKGNECLSSHSLLSDGRIKAGLTCGYLN